MNYKIVITRKEPNPNFAVEMAKYEEEKRYRNYLDKPYPESVLTTDALICELTEEQFKKIKLECFKVFE